MLKENVFKTGPLSILVPLTIKLEIYFIKNKLNASFNHFLVKEEMVKKRMTE